MGTNTARYLDSADGATFSVATWSLPTAALPTPCQPLAVFRWNATTELEAPPCIVALSVVDDPNRTVALETDRDNDVGIFVTPTGNDALDELSCVASPANSTW